MKLQFKAQGYQTDATSAVVDIFKGQSKGSKEDIIDRKIIKNGLYKKEKIIKRFSNNPIQIELLKISKKCKKEIAF